MAAPGSAHHRKSGPARPVPHGESLHQLTAALLRTAGGLDTLLAVQRRLTNGIRRRAARVHGRLPVIPARALPFPAALRQVALEARYR
ncbi:MAG: hypothetical protein JOZ67_11065 [Gammaproteobacteria bacterium]|nr:hypothetical protein [Gammaproteobacteria bacterium]